MCDGVHDDGDPLMVTWVLAWVAHQLPRAPAHLFDANIFYPERNTLAFSETLLVPGAGRGAAALARRRADPDLQPRVPVRLRPLGRRRRAAGAAAHRPRRRRRWSPGSCSRFRRTGSTITPHLQLQQTQFIPLALWAFHRAARLGPPARRRAARRVRRLPDAVVHVLRAVSRAVHGRRLRHDADRRPPDAAAAGSSRWSPRRRSCGDRHDAGRPRLPVGAQGRRRARPGGGGAEQRDVAQLPGAAGGERGVRQGVRAIHASPSAGCFPGSSPSRWRSSARGRGR